MVVQLENIHREHGHNDDELYMYRTGNLSKVSKFILARPRGHRHAQSQDYKRTETGAAAKGGRGRSHPPNIPVGGPRTTSKSPSYERVDNSYNSSPTSLLRAWQIAYNA